MMSGAQRPTANAAKNAAAALFAFLAAAVLAGTAAAGATAEARFPKPQFESRYVMPRAGAPPARAAMLEYLDVAVLVASLGAAGWLVLRARRRGGVTLLTVFSVLYFGFWRKGCVCPVGAIQNAALALFDGGYRAPVVVGLFFLLPLGVTLLFGRAFCAAVCPLGAAQDLVLFRPVKLPAWTAGLLGMLPSVYLGFGVYLAAMGADFVICRFDPFVGFFRMSATPSMLAFGGALLLAGVFVGRPYCRFLCPYGVLLGWMSRFAWRHARITPDDCVNCRLCEEACPFDSILAPTPEHHPESRRAGVRRLAILLAALPALVAGGAWLAASLHAPLSRLHPTVRTAERVLSEDRGAARGTTLYSDAFRQSGQPARELFASALALRARFRKGAWFLGGFIGAVFGARLVGLSVRRRRTEYVIDRASCVSCARCFEYCPRERERVKKTRNGG